MIQRLLAYHGEFSKFIILSNQTSGLNDSQVVIKQHLILKNRVFFSKQPDGFYKFIEPCSHRLYKKYYSWAEELGCGRKCFTRSWEKIGFRQKSRRSFEETKDKFECKLYAIYYDSNLNQMFFVCNHDLDNETLKEFYKSKNSKAKKMTIKLKNQ